MYLNKFIAQAGISSRRKAVELIKNKKVAVNGTIITDPAYQVAADDLVMVNGAVVQQEIKRYVLLNKPKDYITTAADESGRKTVLDALGPKIKERLFPVGRLDRSTTGLLLLTNDGELAQRLAHPRYEISKVYAVSLDKPLTFIDEQKIKKGVELRDGIVHVDTLLVRKDRASVNVTIHSGKYRVVRRLFESLEYRVKKLDRFQYAGLTKVGLQVGQWRFLKPFEVKKLYALTTKRAS